MTTRREFVKVSAAASGALVLPDMLRAGKPSRAHGRAINVLILGGTGFIGPHLVRAVLAAGHTPTLFNRGRTEPRMFPEQYAGLESLTGDRDGDISALRGRRWDAVIDDSGYTPQQVRATATLLRDSVGFYLFTSTRGVYTDFTVHMDEDAPLGPRGIPEGEWTGYGPLKVLAEREVQRAFLGRYAIVRPSIITGPGDTTDRFTYWYVRVDRGGDVLAPGAPSDPLQYIDVRDLVDFYVGVIEGSVSGVFNAEAPASPLSSAEFLYGLRALTAAPVSFSWVDWDFLEAHGLRGGQELPSWRAPVGDDLNYGRMDNRRAIAAGMTFRPLAVTAGDTLTWWKSLPAARRDALRGGPSPEKEREVLSAWRRRT